MQKVASESKWLRGFLVAALYVSVYGCATPPPVTAPSAVSAAPGVTQPALPVPVTPVATTSAVAEPAVIVPIAPVATPVIPAIPVANVEPSAPHIALILPLKSAAFAKSATALQQGFLAAAGLEANGLPVRVYPCNDEKAEVTAVYAQAIKAGAVAVAGPLTRNGVAALAANPDLDVPTLALNQMDMARTDQLYFFGLPVEVEARQMAQWAAKAGLLSATIVRTDTALSKRLAQAFTDSWLKSGGVVIAEKIYAGDATSLRLIPTDAGNMVFLAAEADKARLLRPYISNLLPIFATSQVFSGNTNNLVNYDLAEVRFTDMPWLLQPDHPAVMIYPHATPALTQDMERLYALGIDAYRVLMILYEHQSANDLPLDGVTGKVQLNGRTLERSGTLAVIRQGQGVAWESRPPILGSKPQ
ncbi:MAG: hypothetical protein HOP24_08440 [Sideroxydans sp.]|nr:hypothetical protein [Sideroxydans sp.]